MAGRSTKTEDMNQNRGGSGSQNWSDKSSNENRGGQGGSNEDRGSQGSNENKTINGKSY